MHLTLASHAGGPQNLADIRAGMAGRWWAGRLGGRLGHARLLPPALAIAAAGMAALFWLGSPVAVLAGMAVFGLGFGALQNATYAPMIDRAPESGFGTASAIWNLAYDAGYASAVPRAAAGRRARVSAGQRARRRSHPGPPAPTRPAHAGVW